METAEDEVASTPERFDLTVALDRVRGAIWDYPRAALFELAGDGYRSVLQQVIACIISIRTYDEVTLVLARRLFARAPDADALAALTVPELDTLIAQASFHEAKAGQIHRIAQLALDRFQGELPCDEELLLSLPGVGHKCANLVLGIACGERRIAVDVHVHRVTNRWGLISTRSPDESLLQLEAIVPREHWLELNELLVPFGKHVCTGRAPFCSSCPLLRMCRQVGVTTRR